MRSNSPRRTRRNGAGSATDIQHGEPWMKEFGKATVVPLEGALRKDARIGAV